MGQSGTVVPAGSLLSDGMFVMPWFGGIDLGLRGGVAVLSRDNKVVRAHVTPIIGRPSSPDDYDRERIREVAWAMTGCELVAIEEANVVRVPKRDKRTGRTTMIVSPKATQSLSESVAEWKSALSAEGIEWVLVNARTWQARCLRGMPGKDTKEKACNYVKAVWPDVDLQPGKFTTDQDGIADALLLAHYARTCIQSPDSSLALFRA